LEVTLTHVKYARAIFAFSSIRYLYCVNNVRPIILDVFSTFFFPAPDIIMVYYIIGLIEYCNEKIMAVRVELCRSEMVFRLRMAGSKILRKIELGIARSQG